MSEPKLWIRTMDHLAAGGREPECGERQWNVDIRSDEGRFIRIHVGPRSRELILQMLREENAKVYDPQKGQ